MLFILENKSNPGWKYHSTGLDTCNVNKCKLFRTNESVRLFQKLKGLTETYRVKEVDETELLEAVNKSLDKLYDALAEVEENSNRIAGAEDLTDEIEKLIKKLKKARVYIFGDGRPSFYSSKGDEYYGSVVPNPDKKKEDEVEDDTGIVDISGDEAVEIDASDTTTTS